MPKKPRHERQSEGVYVYFTPIEYAKVKRYARAFFKDNQLTNGERKSVSNCIRSVMMEEVDFAEQEKV